MLKRVLALLVPVTVFAIVADLTLHSPGRAPGLPGQRPDDSMLVKLDSIPSQTAYQCIYVRNDTVFCALQASSVHLRDRLTGAVIDSFTTLSATSACAICAFGDSICVSHISSPEFCEVYTLDGTYVRGFFPTGGVQVRGLDWDGSRFWATSYTDDLSIYLMARDGTVTKTLSRSGGFPSSIARDLVLDPLYPNRLWTSPSTSVPNYLMYVAFDTTANTFTPLDTFNTGLAHYIAGIGFRDDPVDGGCVFVSTFHDSWIWRYQVHDSTVGVSQKPDVCSPGLILTAGPNPARFRSDISYAAAGLADIGIYDADGRRVRSLVSGAPGPDLHHASWDLADDRGRPVADGIYFCKLTAAGATASRKLVVRR